MRYLFKAEACCILSLALLLLACGTDRATLRSKPAAAQPAAPHIEANASQVLTSATGSTPTPVAIPVPIPTPVPAVLPGQGGKPGGSITTVAFADIPHRDVHQDMQETLTSLGPGLAYSRLLRLRTGPEMGQPNLLLECDLCHSWESLDPLTYRFQLRHGARWHNIPPVNGRELIAGDLEYSYARLRAPGWPNAPLFSTVQRIEALDDYTLLVKLAAPDSDGLLSLADGHSKIVAREVVDQYQDLKNSPVIGTGPWIWESSTAGVGTTLNKNRGYFEQGLPLLDRLSIRVIKRSGPDLSGDEARYAAFIAGSIDVYPIPASRWRVLRKTGLAVGSFISRQGGTGLLLSMNVQASGMDNPTVRQAVFKAIDPWDYADRILEGQAFVSVGIPVQRSDWLLDRREIRSGYFANPSEARELLARSGATLPIDLELTVGEFSETELKLGDWIADDLREVGFNPTVRRRDPPVFAEMVFGQQKHYQMALGLVPPNSITNSFLFGVLHSGGRWNVSSHRDSILDSMIEQQAVELNPVRRQEQLGEIQRYVLANAYLFSPATSGTRWVFNRRLSGFYPNTALSEYIYWSRAWLDR